jgi:hypothetical protein
MKNPMLPVLVSVMAALLGCMSKDAKERSKPAPSQTTISAPTPKTPGDGSLKPPPNLSHFLPEGYSILDTARGDLNLDSIPDMLLLLHKTTLTREDSIAEDSATESLVRPLVILIGNKDGTFTYRVENDYAVMCRKCGGAFGDPYSGLVIKKGYFSADHYGGSRERWSASVTFKYDKRADDWFLHKNGGSSYDQFDDEKSSTEWVKTKKDFGVIRFEDFRYEAPGVEE